MTAAASRRSQVVAMALLGHDAQAIATKLGVSVRTIWRDLAEPEVKAELKRLEGERLQAVARKAAALGSSAVVVLATIANDTKQPAAARVSAARGLLDMMLKVGELAAIEERLSVLEDGLAGTGHGKEAPTWRRTA